MNNFPENIDVDISIEFDISCWFLWIDKLGYQSKHSTQLNLIPHVGFLWVDKLG